MVEAEPGLAAGRDEVVRACVESVHRIGEPGTWWTASERVAIAEQARRARNCEVCARRREALSPYASVGTHVAAGPLDAAAVDAAHRLSVDASRLSQRWYEETAEAGVSPAQIVEMVAIVATTQVADTFAYGIGASNLPLPDPQPGEPTRELPAGGRVHTARVPTVPLEAMTGEMAEDIRRRSAQKSSLPPEMARQLAGKVGNILIALSLVPEEQRAWRVLAPLYRSDASVLDLGQRELVASTTSAYNDCFYCTSTHSARLGAYAEGVDLAAVIAGDDDENVGVEHGVELRRLTLAILRRDDERIATSREEVATVLGEQAVSDTAAVAAYFDGMNRIADGTGTNLNPELTPPGAVLAKLPAATRRTATSESDEPV